MPAASHRSWVQEVMGGVPQVELAALDYRAARLVRVVSATSGERTTFGSGEEVVSAR